MEGEPGHAIAQGVGEGEGDEAAGCFRAFSRSEGEDDDAPWWDIGWPGAVEDWEEESLYGFCLGSIALAVFFPVVDIAMAVLLPAVVVVVDD